MRKIQGIKTTYYKLDEMFIMQVEESANKYETYLEMDGYSIKTFMIGFHKDSVKSLQEVIDIMNYNWYDFVEEYRNTQRILEKRCYDDRKIDK